ncbi:membrane protein insertion efficiency factor YidD [Candidatus Gottesmanbacteria bacterium]|nr:membrane protein insertion efficiency factor YidD [Candidatus Gottesmanbacteria bacterium]
MKKILFYSIRFYQRYLSFDTGILKFLFLTDKACRFSPTCSEYMYQAIEAYGIIHGLWLGVKRIVRCHPWNKGGEDTVPINPKHEIRNSKQ